MRCLWDCWAKKRAWCHYSASGHWRKALINWNKSNGGPAKQCWAGALVLGEEAGGAGLALHKGKALEHLMATCPYLWGDCWEDGGSHALCVRARLSAEVHGGRRDGLKWVHSGWIQGTFFFTVRMVKQWIRAQRGYGISILGGFQNWVRQGFWQPGLNSLLVLFCVGGWTRDLLVSLPTWMILWSWVKRDGEQVAAMHSDIMSLLFDDMWKMLGSSG